MIARIWAERDEEVVSEHGDGGWRPFMVDLKVGNDNCVWGCHGRAEEHHGHRGAVW